MAPETNGKKNNMIEGMLFYKYVQFEVPMMSHWGYKKCLVVFVKRGHSIVCEPAENGDLSLT